ncbi:UNVERIFIED_CONTAM: hypothetical protein Sangu_2469000 [Sesamum angustifolium]|uniref:DUSP domain-containing protein n=1 Tax=Sesamum angustifolium TaxID=2727405 RepID=A0AAW2IXK3_9LAMI
MALAKEGKIVLDIEETEATNVANITAASNRHISERAEVNTTTLPTFHFDSFEPIQREAIFVNEKNEIPTEDDDGWILVTCWRRWRQHVNKLHPSLPRKPRLHKHSHHVEAKNKTEMMTSQSLSVTLEEFFPQIFFKRKGKTVSAPPCTDRRQPLVSYYATLSFTDKDLLLRSKPHSRLPSFWGLYKNKGWPRLHENIVVPSTLHQYFKYIKHGEIMKVDVDMKPFTETESYFADLKLYLDPNNMQEVLPSKYPVGYSSEEIHPKAMPKENNDEKISKAT